jgi:hypothetical protein
VVPFGSQFEKSVLDRMVKSPPYCGVPRPSHQFTVVPVVVDEVFGLLVVDVVEVVGVDVSAVDVVNVVDVVVTAFVQEENTKATTTKKLNPNHKILPFN